MLIFIKNALGVVHHLNWRQSLVGAMTQRLLVDLYHPQQQQQPISKLALSDSQAAFESEPLYRKPPAAHSNHLI